MRISEPAGLRSSRPLRACALALTAVVALAACGGSSKSDNPTASGSGDSAGSSSTAAGAATPTPAASAAASAGAGAAAPNPFPTASAAPKGSSALTGIPAITSNATAMDKQPVIAKGTGAAPTNLVIRDLVVGTGKSPSPSDTVNVQYVGALYADGTVFDSSWQRGAAASFPLAGVVPGFAGGIMGMKIGGRREIVIPAFLGYGAAGGGPVPPNATLVFVVDLVGIQ